MMHRAGYILVAALAAVSSRGNVDAFKFMANWQAPKVLTESQKVEIAKTEERFGDKSKFAFVCDDTTDYSAVHIISCLFYASHIM